MTKRPSFNGKTVTLNAGDSTTLTDTNNVLQDFKGKESIPKGISVKRNGNKLTVTASTTAAENSTYILNKIRPEIDWSIYRSSKTRRTRYYQAYDFRSWKI